MAKDSRRILTGKRRDAQALALDCPTCGAKAGEVCNNYAGVHCAPHAARYVVPEEKPKRPAPVKLSQRFLFEVAQDAQREGGL